MSMDFAQIPILTLLPQRPPFVMVDKLLYYDQRTTVCSFVPTEGNIFVKDGVFVSSGLVENIAQTCAARIGYYNKYILRRGIRLGFIGAIRNLSILHAPALGSELITTIRITDEVFDITLAEASVSQNGRLIAQTTIKIAQGGDAQS